MHEREANSQDLLMPQEKEFQHLFRLSFYYSQGDIDNQANFFEWFVQKDFVHKEVFFEAPPFYLKNLNQPKIHAQVTKKDSLTIVDEVWEEIQVAIQRKSEIVKLELLIGENVLKADNIYMDKKRPKRRSTKDFFSDSAKDPHASFFRKYILQQHPTGSDAFNSLFGKVKSAFETIPTESAILKKMEFLAEKWESHHKNEKFFDGGSFIPTP